MSAKNGLSVSGGFSPAFVFLNELRETEALRGQTARNMTYKTNNQDLKHFIMNILQFDDYFKVTFFVCV